MDIVDVAIEQLDVALIACDVLHGVRVSLLDSERDGFDAFGEVFSTLGIEVDEVEGGDFVVAFFTGDEHPLECPAAAYATIACQMAYLKAYYPLEFYAAILETSSSASDAKFNEYISEMKNRNIAIFSPNINLSNKEFSVVDNGLLFPLNAIHGVDELTINSILNERKEKPFDDFFDFVNLDFTSENDALGSALFE